MSFYSICLTVSAYSDGKPTYATVSFSATDAEGSREMHHIDLPPMVDGPFDSPEDMLRAIVPHVVEYI